MSIETANFVALDFETANEDLSSICQVGIVLFERGIPTKTLNQLIDPVDYFAPINVSIHGIDEASVCGAPTFLDFHQKIVESLSGHTVVTHSAFDQAALRQAERRCGVGLTECRWLDTTRVVRRQWPQFAEAGYGLANLTAAFGIEIGHHDAAEDARGTGLVLVRAIVESGLALDEWLVRAYRPLSTHRIVKEGSPAGPLYGDTVVFTGALSIPRREAAEKAASLGLAVDGGVTKRTTLLVVGDQDVKRLAPGASRSSKHQKANELIASGQPIRILRESDFLALVGMSGR